MIFFIIFSLIFFQSSLQAQVYPTQVKLIIRSQSELVGQDEFFEILEFDDYILIPLVSLSRWLDIDLNYDRDKEILTVYYEENDINIQIDFKLELYYDFPEWSTDPPMIVEGDFYVATALIEYLTGAKVNWQPRRQELILDFGYVDKKEEISELQIKKRPEEFAAEAVVKDSDFSVGAIQYKIGFNYEFEDDSEADLLISENMVNLYGRAGNWGLSAKQLIEYDFDMEEYNFESELLRARNIENDRVIILGDQDFRLSDTLNRVDLRGFFLQYPIQQISDRRAYTSISGQAAEGSTITLYGNDRKIGEKYIYQGESSYHFENVPLTENRTNIYRILITDLEGRQTEILKKVAGSLNIYEAGTNEAIIGVGSNNRNKENESIFEIGGLRFKYAPTNKLSLFWELGVERIYNDSEYEGPELGSILRVAVRPEDLPLVFLTEWLAGRDVELIDHGVKSSTLYTREDGYIKASFAYIPPVIKETVDVEAGQQALVNFEKELDENWLLELDLENSRSILEMENFDISTINLAFDYSDRARNSINIGTEIGRKEEEINWKKLNLTEKSRDWFDITLKGRTFSGKTRFGSEVTYIMSDIIFYDDLSSGELSKKEDYAYIKLNVSSSLTDNLVLSSSLKSDFTWLEGSRDESDTDVDLRVRLKTGKYTSITAGISSEVEYEKDRYGNDSTEELEEVEVFVTHRIPRYFTLTGGIIKTFLEDESYYRANAGLDYEDPEENWELSLDYEYTAAYREREKPQHEFEIEMTRHLFSGLEASVNYNRSYSSSKSEEPEYEAMFYLSQSLGFTGGRVIGQKYPEYKRDDYSSFIAGQVYLDINGSKTRDNNEPLLEEIGIFLDGRRDKSGKDGQFIFENLRTGLYQVGFNFRDLPEKYKVVTEDKIIDLRENENIFLELALTQIGEISGQIVFYDNNVGKESAEERTLNWVKIEIEEINRVTFSRSDGSFNFRNIPLGEYTIKVVEDSLHEGTKIDGEGIYKVKITPENLMHQELKIELLPEN